MLKTCSHSPDYYGLGKRFHSQKQRELTYSVCHCTVRLWESVIILSHCCRRFLLREQSNLGVEPTTHLRLVSRLRPDGVTHPFVLRPGDYVLNQTRGQTSQSEYLSKFSGDSTLSHHFLSFHYPSRSPSRTFITPIFVTLKPRVSSTCHRHSLQERSCHLSKCMEMAGKRQNVRHIVK